MNPITLSTSIQICRLCGRVTEEASGIFYGTIHNLHEKINHYLPITVRLTDTLPLISCLTCTNILLSFEQLVLTCIEANKSFERMQANTSQQFGVLNTAFCPPDIKPVETLTINDFYEKSTENVFDTSDVDNYEPFSNDDSFIQPSDNMVKEVNQQPENPTLENPVKTDGVKPRKKRTYPKTIIHRPEDDNADYIKVLIDEHVHYKCTVCQKLLRHKHGFKQHFLIHTDERPFACEICGFKFRIRQNLRHHVDRVHHGIKNHPCEICGLKFATRTFLKNHLPVHSYVKPFMCEVCGKGFGCKSHFTDHMQIHNGFKFCCGICNKGYTSRVQLKYHMQTHTGVIDKPYKCNVCPAQFFTNKALLSHKRSHEKKFKCTHCTLSFTTMYYLRVHTSRKHTEQTENDSSKVKDNTDDNKDKIDTADKVDNDKEKLEDKNKTSKSVKQKKTKKVAVNKGTKQKDKVTNKKSKIIKTTKLIKKKKKPKKKVEDFEITFKVEGENTIIRKSLRKKSQPNYDSFVL